MDKGKFLFLINLLDKFVFFNEFLSFSKKEDKMKYEIKTKYNTEVKLDHDSVVAKIKTDAAFRMLQNFKVTRDYINKNNRLGRGV